MAQTTLKYRWIVIFIFLLATVGGYLGLKKVIIEYSNESMFLPDDPLIVMTDDFKEIFGNDQYVGVLVESDSLFSKQNLELLRRLSNELQDSVPYADKVTSLTDVEFTVGTDYGMEIVHIVPDVIPSSSDSLKAIKARAFSKKNFAEKLVSNDGKYSWIMLKLWPFHKDWQARGEEMPELQVGTMVQKIIDCKEYQPLHPRATGMPYFNYNEKKFFDAESGRVVGIALVIAFLFLGLSTRSFRGVFIPILATISSVIIVFGLAGFLRFKIAGLVLTVPILLSLAISIGYSIHVFTFYKKYMRATGKRKDSLIHAMEETGWPLLFTALTTFSALLSFLILPVPTIRFIGLITAGSVLVILLTILFLMPALLSFGKDRLPISSGKEESSNHWLSHWLEMAGNKILAYPKTILISAAVISAILIYGMTKVQASFDIEKTIGQNVPYVKNILDIADTELGSLYSYDLMIELPKEGDAKLPQNLKKLEELSEYIQSFKLTKRTTSILDIVKDMNQVLNEDNPDYYTIPSNKEQLAQMLLLYENAGGSEAEYWMDYEYKRLRIMTEVDSYSSGELRHENNLLHKKAEELFPGAKLSVVGTVPKYAKVNEYVVKGQINSFFIALGIITLLLMIVFGSVKTGLVGLIPNIVPAITVGGIMGWFGIPLDMMTVTIIPMILGLAVDDTIHFFNHGRLEFERLGVYKPSIIKTFGNVGVALVLTTLILSANFLTYTTSTANIYIHMGVLATAGMLSALAADLLITPILFKQLKIFGNENPK